MIYIYIYISINSEESYVYLSCFVELSFEKASSAHVCVLEKFKFKKCITLARTYYYFSIACFICVRKEFFVILVLCILLKIELHKIEFLMDIDFSLQA